LVKNADWQPIGIDDLEPAVWEAVLSSTNTLVTAGPGAGKTELLGQRAAFLLQTGACPYPRRILAISFKRDAAKNLKERVAARCGQEYAARFASMTFDAFAKILLDRFWRALPESWTLTNGYSIAPAFYRQDFNQLQQQTRDDFATEGAPAKWVMDQVGYHPEQNEHISIQRAIMAVTEDAYKIAFQRASLVSINIPDWASLLPYVLYRRNMSVGAAQLSFPMIGRLAELIIRSNPKIKAALQATYSHVFLDEFQDTTTIQYDLLSSIFAGSSSVITAVGDDKQRIMGWAGAKRDVFTQYSADFLPRDLHGATIGHLNLQSNYRSNEAIVEILNTLKTRLAPNEPDFIAVRPAPELPPEQICSVIRSTGPQQERENIANFIAQSIAAGTPAHEIAILVRQRASDREESIRPAFQDHGLKLRNEDRDVGGGVKIQELMTEPLSQLITDTFELLIKPRSGECWGRVLETIYDIDGIHPDEEEHRAEEAMIAFADFLKINRPAFARQPFVKGSVTPALKIIFDFFGAQRLTLLAPQYQQGDYFTKVLSATTSYLGECAEQAADWLGALSLYRGEQQVPILTITKSKGLEYKIVIILGMDDNDWWSFSNDPEEGHSNFFVAASRAKERLFLALCNGQRTQKIAEIYDLLRSAGVAEIDSANMLV
jgi:superfamily I DNA/RNA helicase